MKSRKIKQIHNEIEGEITRKMMEFKTLNQRVEGSIPSAPTREIKGFGRF